MSDDAPRDDRRDDARIDQIRLVQVSRFDEEGFRADLATGRTLNVSRGGIRLELYHPLPLRSVVGISLAVGDEIVDVSGTVVYLEAIDDERSGMGIAFHELDSRARKLVDRLVDQAEGREAADG